MKEYKEKIWQHETTGFDGNTILFGVNIFDYQWKNTEETTEVKDPLYGRKYRFPVYEVTIGEQKHIFAAGEFSNCVWGFYIQKF